MRLRVCSETAGLPRKARETVGCETPAIWAISNEVALRAMTRGEPSPPSAGGLHCPFFGLSCQLRRETSISPGTIAHEAFLLRAAVVSGCWPGGVRHPNAALEFPAACCLQLRAWLADFASESASMSSADEASRPFPDLLRRGCNPCSFNSESICSAQPLALRGDAVQSDHRCRLPARFRSGHGRANRRNRG